MTDAAYAFIETNKERKSLARQAKYRKNGSKSKKCTLPQDNMTKKELMAMNGPVISWDLKKAYTFDEFKQMPEDIQIRYINRFLTLYDCTLVTIAEEVMHANYKTVWHYVTKANIRSFLNLPHRGHRTKEHDILRLRNALAVVKLISEEEPKQIVEYCKNDVEATEAAFNCMKNKDICEPSVVIKETEQTVTDAVEFDTKIDDTPIIIESKPVKPNKLIGGTFHMNGFDMSLLQALAGMFKDDCHVIVTVTSSNSKEVNTDA